MTVDRKRYRLILLIHRKLEIKKRILYRVFIILTVDRHLDERVDRHLDRGRGWKYRNRRPLHTHTHTHTVTRIYV